MAVNLSSSDSGDWVAALSAYDPRVAALSLRQNKPDLPDLDAFYMERLPSLIGERGFITKDELSRVVRWKLSRGKWRPRLQAFADALEERQVEEASRKAFSAVREGDLARALNELTVLKGVGPATASAVLAAYKPDVAPFMSDEAMLAALGNAKDYTVKQYLKLADVLQGKAKELSLGGRPFTASDIERALWSSAVGAMTPDDDYTKVNKPKAAPVEKKLRKRKQRI